jgi:hypothetical protein
LLVAAGAVLFKFRGNGRVLRNATQTMEEGSEPIGVG